VAGGSQVVRTIEIEPQPEWLAWLSRGLMSLGFIGAVALLALHYSAL
jgi:hypothetical protein